MNIAGNKKALSQALLRVLTVALVLACAAAFMPLLSGQAFAASKPAKVKFKSLTQADVMTSVGQYKITAKWKKAKKAKKYKVTYTDGSETKSITTKKKAASFEGAVGSTYNVKVQGINGKAKGKASAKTITVVDNRATIAGVNLSYESGTLYVGDTVTAKIAEKDAKVTYQWYRGGTAIPGATSASYTATAEDLGQQLKVVVTVDPSDLAYVGSAEATTPAVAEQPKEDFFTDQKVVISGGKAVVTMKQGLGATVKSYEWFAGEDKIAGATSDTYDPIDTAYEGKVLTCVVTYTVGGEDKTITVDFGKIAKDISATYYLNPVTDGKVPNTSVAVGKTVKAGIYSVAYVPGDPVNEAKAYAGTGKIEYTWKWYYTVLEDGIPVVKEGKATGATFAIDDATKASTYVELNAVVTPGDDNVGGELGPVYFSTAADAAKSVEIIGDPAFNNKLTAKVTGTLGVIEGASVDWIVNGSVDASGPEYTVTDPSYVGGGLKAKYGATESALKEITAATIAKVEITNARESEPTEAQVVDTNGNTVDPSYLDQKYFKSDTEPAVYDNEVNAYAWSYGELGKWYGYSVSTKSGVTAYKPVTDMKAAAVQAGKGRSYFTDLTITDKDGNVKSASVAIGDVLTAAAKPTDSGASYTWYRGDKKKKLTTGATYTVTKADYEAFKADSSMAIYVYAEAPDYFETSRAFPIDPPVPQAMTVTISGTKVGDTFSASAAEDPGATFKWLYAGTEPTAADWASAPSGKTYTAPAAAYDQYMWVQATPADTTYYATTVKRSANTVKAAQFTAAIVPEVDKDKLLATDKLKIEAPAGSISYVEWYCNGSYVTSGNTLTLDPAYAGDIYALITPIPAYGGTDAQVNTYGKNYAKYTPAAGSDPEYWTLVK